MIVCETTSVQRRDNRPKGERHAAGLRPRVGIAVGAEVRRNDPRHSKGWIPSMLTNSSKAAVPTAVVRLYPILPNPFSESTCITFDVAGERAYWRMELVAEDGELVRTFEGNDTGCVSIIWHGDDARRTSLPCGTYTCHLKCGESTETRRIYLIR